MADNPAVPDNGPDQGPRSAQAPKPHAERGPSFAAAEPRVDDLSAEIARSVTKSPGQRVTCRRIVGNKYRCNWWAALSTNGYDNPGMTGQMVTTHRVAHSELLHVTLTGSGLKIERVSGDR